ncbi:hypothetical protein QBZ16_004915 [Prototheca wickerhamii]|uniref:Peptidase M14 domain-containing protein n=1 Tax=Prototheca wickerhamii TaxID=3111 RepID=A0AAD9MMP0_PROWI|nr:hypothetical protein QBZ16_004915 [Prototheca wickerhamii]
MLQYSRRCSSIARLHELGRTVEGRPILALELSKSAGREDGKPHFKYVGNVHGDEPTGRVLTLALAEHICEAYGADNTIRRLVEDLHLWLVPSMNPDGFKARTRANRNFPDRFASPSMRMLGGEEPEVHAIANWTLSRPFVASAALHEGALVANYPWDGSEDKSTKYVRSPDDATFKHMAAAYATWHKTMSKPNNKASFLPLGTFFRPLAPGKHKVRASAPGYASSVVDVEVPVDGKGAYVEIMLSKGVTPEQLLQRDPESNGVEGINAQNQQLATLLASQIARAAAIFNIDEVIVLDDVPQEQKGSPSPSAALMAHVIQYLETPQYLRK